MKENTYLKKFSERPITATTFALVAPAAILLTVLSITPDGAVSLLKNDTLITGTAIFYSTLITGIFLPLISKNIEKLITEIIPKYIDFIWYSSAVVALVIISTNIKSNETINKNLEQKDSLIKCQEELINSNQKTEQAIIYHEKNLQNLNMIFLLEIINILGERTSKKTPTHTKEPPPKSEPPNLNESQKLYTTEAHIKRTEDISKNLKHRIKILRNEAQKKSKECQRIKSEIETPKTIKKLPTTWGIILSLIAALKILCFYWKEWPLQDKTSSRHA